MCSAFLATDIDRYTVVTSKQLQTQLDRGKPVAGLLVMLSQHPYIPTCYQHNVKTV